MKRTRGEKIFVGALLLLCWGGGATQFVVGSIEAPPQIRVFQFTFGSIMLLLGLAVFLLYGYLPKKLRR